MCQDGDTNPEPVRISIVQYFEALPDPREGPNAVHKLIDIIVIAVCAVILVVKHVPRWLSTVGERNRGSDSFLNCLGAFPRTTRSREYWHC